MEHPEYLYWALVFMVAWPCSLFSRCSAVLFATWAIGQVAVFAGLPEAKVQTVLYALAFVVSLTWARSWRCRLVALLYLPLFFETLMWWEGPEDYDTWWSIFYVAMVQVLLLVTTVDYATIRHAWEGFKRRREVDDVFKYLTVELDYILCRW